MEIGKNITSLLEGLPSTVELVAVSKTKSNEEILEAYNAGQRKFGENKIQDMTRKYEILPKDIQWHMIGHVQSNKVKYMAPYVSLIQGGDSLKLLKEINKQAQKNNRIIDCLLQIHIAKEESKFGLSVRESQQAIKIAKELPHLRIKGLMGMATFTDDQKQIEREFAGLKSLYDQFIEQKIPLEVLSMGMSGDFLIAIEQGSNMIRVGSKIFGPRNY
ncbi:MAG: YggS family pyridoxal phosphate-dependent enzyme [Flavobacteriaceae bacterium]|nr:YggS family pyridoxal phosphate-dependent enzyme [Flavobacteriaceae bacterium]